MALTGFLHNGVCWPTYNEAMSVKFGSDPVLETTATQGDKIHFYQHLNGTQWVWSEYSTSGAAWTLQYHSPMPAISFTPCDPMLSVTLNSLFTIPAPADITQAWMIAFTLPLILWLTAWGFGVVVNMFSHKDD